MRHAFPTLFVSHGAPTFALEPGLAGASLMALGAELPRPRAIVVVSPHWTTRGGVGVTASEAPATLHDFGGFPPALYQLGYPAPGLPAMAEEIRRLLSAAGWSSLADPRRGLDHGAWVPLLHLVPTADVPVLQVSLPMPLDPLGAWQLGRALRPLREAGVLLVGSGSLTHNLYEFRAARAPVEGYVERFARWTAHALQAADLDALLDYRNRAPEAERAHPTEEHILPLFVALGAAGEHYALRVLEGGVQHGVLAMDHYLFCPSTVPSAQAMLHAAIPS